MKKIISGILCLVFLPALCVLASLSTSNLVSVGTTLAGTPAAIVTNHSAAVYIGSAYFGSLPTITVSHNGISNTNAWTGKIAVGVGTNLVVVGTYISTNTFAATNAGTLDIQLSTLSLPFYLMLDSVSTNSMTEEAHASFFNP